MNKELLTVVVIAAIEDRPLAQPKSLKWVLRWWKDTRQTAEEMLPRMLSPTGAAPVTHCGCEMCLTPEQAADLAEFIVNEQVPVVATIIGPQENNSRSTIENRDKWLPARGLKLVV